MTIESNGRQIELNEIQVLALEKISDFLNQDENLFFCLSGSAGTGKTTLIKQALKDKSNIVVTAPTHKAKKVIANMTGYKAKTIHSILGLRPGLELEDFHQNNLLFASTGKDTMCEFGICVIDEASMLNSDIVDLIKRKSSEFDCKIIFMGDENQLPPVKEKLSKVFTDKEILHFRLTKVERQKVGNPLISLYDKILSDIGSSVDKYQKVSDYDETTKFGYIFESDPKAFTDKLVSQFKHGEYSESKILCWTNQKVNQWNNLIRKQVLGEEYKYPINVGEFLMAYRTVQDLVNNKLNVLENSCEYKVLSVKLDKKEQRYNDNKIGSEDQFATIIGYKCMIENLDTGRIDTIFIVCKESYDIFRKIEKLKGDYAKKAVKGSASGYAWKMYYEFRDRFFLLGNILDERGNFAVSKDLDYYYAITVHKSQGSTYENVFVDENNLDENQTSPERNRLKYVALSRPTHAAFIYFRKSN